MIEILLASHITRMRYPETRWVDTPQPRAGALRLAISAIVGLVLAALLTPPPPEKAEAEPSQLALADER